MQWNTQDLAGLRFGRLTAQTYLGHSKWFCRCDCGGSAVTLVSNLKRGNSTSCGCRNREVRTKHGMAGTSLYRTWIAMRSRCTNPKDHAFHNYGGRGIRVCERWDDFPTFLADVGMRPPGHELDRIDNNGNYEPGNVRWLPKRKNLHNKRTNRLITWSGETHPVAVWAERLGIHERTLHNRLTRGWSVDRAMTQATQQRAR